MVGALQVGSLVANPFTTFMLGGRWYYVDASGAVLREDLLTQLLGVPAWPLPEPEPEPD
eukprot:SAG11_NODE_2014_length_3922_cov_1.929898_2_plen_59_part_00